MALLADLLGLPAEERYPPLPEDPKRRREQTLVALVGHIERLARRRPILSLFFEDAHWANWTSLELLDRIVQRVSDLPVLLVLTCRPGSAPPSGGAAPGNGAGAQPPQWA